MARSAQSLGSAEAMEGEDLRARIDHCFRAVHSLKGLLGATPLRQSESMTHECESLLDELRRDPQPASTEVVDVLVEVADSLDASLSAFAEDRDEPVERVAGRR